MDEPLAQETRAAPAHRYRIATASLLTALDIDPRLVHPDDVENGIDFAQRLA